MIEVKAASLAFGTYALLHSRLEGQFGSKGTTWPGSAVSKMKESLQWPEQLVSSDFEYLRKKIPGMEQLWLSSCFSLHVHLLLCEVPAPFDSVLQESFVPPCFSAQQR